LPDKSNYITIGQEHLTNTHHHIIATASIPQVVTKTAIERR